MKAKLSLLMIVKNAEKLIQRSLMSVEKLVDEIIIVDNMSTDKTIEIAQKFGAHIHSNKSSNLGILRQYAIDKAKGEWILVLDSDEILSLDLRKEIKEVISKNNNELIGYHIGFKNHFLGKPVKYGGENYKKIRLFKKKYAQIDPLLVHEQFALKQGKAGVLKNKINHYSYRSLIQTYRKFTNYALREAIQKHDNKEKTSLKKVFLYPPHMFWARFIKDKGYKDGLFRIPLDLGFAYMEFLTYVILGILNL